MLKVSRPALYVVLAALIGCAIIGFWLGLRDSVRKDAPSWAGGAPEKVQTPTGNVTVTDAVALDPNAPAAAKPSSEAETRPEEKKPADTVDDAAVDGDVPTTARPLDKAPTKPKPAEKAPAQPDAIGDIIQSAPPPPPDVPY